MIQCYPFLYLLCISCPMDLQCPIKAVTINQSICWLSPLCVSLAEIFGRDFFECWGFKFFELRPLFY